jgi:hypothetical protein
MMQFCLKFSRRDTLTHPINPSIFCILDKTGSIIGTGFLAVSNLGVTCVHVMDATYPDAENRLQIKFTGQK